MIRVTTFALLGLLLLKLGSYLHANPQLGALTASPSSLQEAAINELLDQPVKTYQFSRASLNEVIRLLAADAGISFIGMPDSESKEDVLVTFSLKAAPFQALQAIAKIHGIALIYDTGIWYLQSNNDQELIARTYRIKYNTQEVVDIGARSISGGGAMRTATTLRAM